MSLLISTYYAESPREAAISVAGGLQVVTNRLINVTLSTFDWVTGFDNVTEMKVWGDLDPNFQPERFGVNPAGAEWIPFEKVFPVVLSAGNGNKTITAEMRNASGVVSADLTNTVDLEADPHPTVLWTDGQQLPSATGDFQFGWSSSHPWDTTVIAVAPSDDAPFDDCEPLIELIGPGTAGTLYVTNVNTLSMTQVDPAPTQSGIKRLRIFISSGGKWYSLPIVPEPFHVAVWDESVWDGDDRWE